MSMIHILFKKHTVWSGFYFSTWRETNHLTNGSREGETDWIRCQPEMAQQERVRRKKKRNTDRNQKQSCRICYKRVIRHATPAGVVFTPTQSASMIPLSEPWHNHTLDFKAAYCEIVGNEKPRARHELHAHPSSDFFSSYHAHPLSDPKQNVVCTSLLEHPSSERSPMYEFLNQMT